MTPKESRYTFLAGVAVALFGAFAFEIDPHTIAASSWDHFRPLLVGTLTLFLLSMYFLYCAATAASRAAQERVDRNFDRLGTAFDRDHHVDAFGYLGAGCGLLALGMSFVDRWIHARV